MRVLKDKVAVVTGAASGIGRGIAAALEDEGCHVVVADIDEQKAGEVAEELAAKGVDSVGVEQGTEAHILNTGSENSLGMAHTGAAFYTASKPALLGLSDVRAPRARRSRGTWPKHQPLWIRSTARC